MAVQQILSRRYIDYEKLAKFWRTHVDFKDKACSITVKTDSYVVQIPRAMTQEEITSIYYDQAMLERMEEEATGNQ